MLAGVLLVAAIALPTRDAGFSALTDSTGDFETSNCFIDSDADTVCDRFEDDNPDADDNPATNPGPDTDRDLAPNALDADDDGDGLATAAESPDPNGDGAPLDARDVDRDGEADFLDLPTTPTGNVAASLLKLSASAGGLDDGDGLGAVTPIGDLDRDGIVDIAVGVDGDDDGGPNRGAVYIAFLNTSGSVRTAQKISDTAGGLAASLGDGDRFGSQVALIGDLDGDGRNELAVAAPDTADGGSDRGAVYILFLDATGMVRREQKISSLAGGLSTLLADGDSFGSGLAGPGDVDGDGLPDLAVGAAGDDGSGVDQGAVHLLTLAADGTVKASRKIGGAPEGLGVALDDDDQFGVAIAGPGDIDGDGTPDLVVGAWGDDDGGLDCGAMYALFLDPDGSPRADQKISNSSGGLTTTLDSSDRFGASVGGIGDLDNDGTPDLLVGATGDDDGGPDRGAVYLFRLTSTGTITSEAKFSSTGGGVSPVLDDEDNFGSSVAGIGDLDGDGSIGLAVGAWADDDGGPGRGAVYLFDLTELHTATVNATADSPDATTGDGICWTGALNAQGDPECTLRAAIEEANATPSINQVHFAIPASDPGHRYYRDDAAVGLSTEAATTLDDASIIDFDGDYPNGPHSWWRIGLASSLPDITSPLDIDGSTQTGFVANTQLAPAGLDGRWTIEISGSGTTPAGLEVSAPGSRLHGLVVNKQNILAVINNAAELSGSLFGTDPTGTVSRSAPNNMFAVYDTSGLTMIGGEDPADRNLMSGHRRGPYVVGTVSIVGNIVGLDMTASVALGPMEVGMILRGSSAMVGGITTASANVIGGIQTGQGVLIDGGAENAVLGNVIFGNDGLGIDLSKNAGSGDGVTANDAGDGDTGPNGLLNTPLITSAVAVGAVTTVDFSLDVPAGNYRVEFFANPSGAHPLGSGEGERFLGSRSIVTAGSGSFSIEIDASPADLVTATLTQDLGGRFGSTSEFSAAFVVT